MLQILPMQWVTYNRHFRLGRKGAWWELPLDAKLGLTYSGEYALGVWSTSVQAVVRSLVRVDTGSQTAPDSLVLPVKPCVIHARGAECVECGLPHCYFPYNLQADPTKSQQQTKNGLLNMPIADCGAKCLFKLKLNPSSAGSPHIEVGLQNMPVALTLAAGLLVAGMPITVKRKEVRRCSWLCPADAGCVGRAMLCYEGSVRQLVFRGAMGACQPPWSRCARFATARPMHC